LCRESHSAERFVCQILATEGRMASSIVTIPERSAASTKSAARVGITSEPIGGACFNDWKRFCFVLREIASGDNGRPLSGVDVQQRAQSVLSEYGYTWPVRAQVCAPVVAATAAPENPNTHATVQSSTSTKLKSVGKEQLRSGRRRSEQRPAQHPSVRLQAAFTR
jgi:hypothetical protein